MAGGWTGDSAVQEQIDSSIEDAVAHARSQLPQGEEPEPLRRCGVPIPRRAARPCPACVCA